MGVENWHARIEQRQLSVFIVDDLGFEARDSRPLTELCQLPHPAHMLRNLTESMRDASPQTSAVSNGILDPKNTRSAMSRSTTWRPFEEKATNQAPERAHKVQKVARTAPNTFLNNSRALPNKTRVLRQIEPESSPERSGKSLSHNFFVVPFLSLTKSIVKILPSVWVLSLERIKRSMADRVGKSWPCFCLKIPDFA